MDTDPTTTNSQANAASETSQNGEVTNWQAEAEKWKHFARTHEANWKKASGELEKLTKAGMSDSDRAVAEAEERGRQAALASLLNERAQDKLDAAAARAGVDLGPIRGHLDVTKFLADGQISTQAISEFVTGLAAGAPKTPRFPQNVGMGPQGSSAGAGQLTRDQLRGMSPREIAQAKKDGRLDALMRGEI